MFLRHEDLHRSPPGLDANLRPAALHILADRRIRNHRLVLINQTVKDSLGGMALLPRSIKIRDEHLIDHGPEPVQSRRRAGGNLAGWRLSGREGLSDRPSGNMMLSGKRADRPSFDACVPTDPCE